MSEDELHHRTTIRRRLAVAELECAEGLVRISCQSRLLMQHDRTRSGVASRRLTHLIQRQSELEKSRDDLKARLQALEVPDPAA
jgi:hypothetical protein